MAHTLDGIIRSDRLFTLPGAFLIVVLGIGTAMMAQLPILRTGWIWQSIVLLSISGLIFMWQVAPLQRRLRQLALDAAEGKAWDAAVYRRLSRRWEAWGLLAIGAPLAAVVLMIVKPA